MRDNLRQIGGRVITLGIVVLFGLTGRFVQAADVKLEQTDGTVKVTVDGKPFAEYLTSHPHQPMIWPIHGPTGLEMTGKQPEDHPHHDSLWFSHGIVNDLDFWLEPRDRSNKGNKIVHREFATVESGETGKIVTLNDWMNSDGAKVCEDERTIVFGADENGWWIDFTVVVSATEGDVTFGNTKEGAFAIRVPATMTVDAKEGGKIRNSRGQQDGDAWGMSADWVDYSGPADGKPAGIVVFDMPDSFRHPARWHVRTYGLFTANPFGEKDFPQDENKQGKQGVAVVKKGETLKLHYRVLFYDGVKTEEQLKAMYKEYSE